LWVNTILFHSRRRILSMGDTIKKPPVRIKIKPKTVALDKDKETKEREIERQHCYGDEIQSLRCELETMKMTMNEMKRAMNEMSMKLEFQKFNHGHGHSHGHSEFMTHRGNSATEFGEWTSGLEITRQDLEAMIESNDVTEWASKFIVADLKQRSIYPHPLCALKGSRNELLIYDGGAWKKMTDQEFASSTVNNMFKKLLAVFTAWKNEHYNRILTSEHFSTLYHSNYARILSFNENASKLKMKLFHALLL
jgi:hypothetical protein